MIGYANSHAPLGGLPIARRILEANRIVESIRKEVLSQWHAREPVDVFAASEPPRLHIVIPRPQVLQARTTIDLLAGELEVVGLRAGGGAYCPEDVVLVGVDHFTLIIGQRQRRAKGVREACPELAEG